MLSNGLNQRIFILFLYKYIIYILKYKYILYNYICLFMHLNIYRQPII